MGLIKSMKAHGWVGRPITAIEHNDDKYIIDGHHRTYAARKAFILVEYRIIDVEELRKEFQYDSVEQVIRAHAQAGHNRIRLR